MPLHVQPLKSFPGSPSAGAVAPLGLELPGAASVVGAEMAHTAPPDDPAVAEKALETTEAAPAHLPPRVAALGSAPAAPPAAAPSSMSAGDPDAGRAEARPTWPC